MDNNVQENNIKETPDATDTKEADAHKLPIPRRPFMSGTGTAEDTKSDTESKENKTHAPLMPSRHNVIKPLNDIKIPDTPEDKPKPASPKFMDTKPVAKKSTVRPLKTAAPSSTEDTTATSPNVLESNSVPATKKDTNTPNPTIEKRRQEVEDIIESHRYFLPFNAAVRRRTVKINFGLTLIVFILALVLIDLMLDSGTIILLQKVPHTHFFSVSNNK